MRRALRRLAVRLAVALESLADLAVGEIGVGRMPAGELSASLTTGEIQIRGRYWRVSALAGQRVALVAFYGEWDEASLVAGIVAGMEQARGLMASGVA